MHILDAINRSKVKKAIRIISEYEKVIGHSYFDDNFEYINKQRQIYRPAYRSEYMGLSDWKPFEEI